MQASFVSLHNMYIFTKFALLNRDFSHTHAPDPPSHCSPLNPERGLFGAIMAGDGGAGMERGDRPVFCVHGKWDV